MKITRILKLVIVFLGVSCLSDNDPDFPGNNCLPGQGVIVTKTIDLADFHSINSAVVADIFLTQGPKEDITIEAQQNILDQIKTEVVNEELRLSFNRCVDILERVKIYISIPEIKNLNLPGVGDIIAQNDFDLTELDVVLTGVGDIILKGTANEFNILLTGVGNVKAFLYNSDICDIILTGVGDVEVFVNDDLNVTLTGVGKVYYKGNPSITATVTGSGSVVDAN